MLDGTRATAPGGMRLIALAGRISVLDGTKATGFDFWDPTDLAVRADSVLFSFPFFIFTKILRGRGAQPLPPSLGECLRLELTSPLFLQSATPVTSAVFGDWRGCCSECFRQGRSAVPWLATVFARDARPAGYKFELVFPISSLRTRFNDLASSQTLSSSRHTEAADDDARARSVYS